MAKEIVNRILKEYASNLPLYQQFTKKIEDLILEFLSGSNLKVHSVSSRVKKEESLKNKLLGHEDKYESLQDITDISGIRIITYFEDEVDKIGKIIKEEFETDEEKSIDARALLDPDRFGYLSTHYIVKLHPNRLKLSEYKRFSDCVAEIQVRSILQHAWAEIEHDSGYKSKQEVPREIRRKFSRLAGILELADQEFKSIRDELIRYEEEVTELIKIRSSEILVDKTSVTVFVKDNDTLRKIDQRIASNAVAKLQYVQSYVDGLVRPLQWFDIKTVGTVEHFLSEYKDNIVQLAAKTITKKENETLCSGIGLFYLCYILVLQDSSEEKIIKYLSEFSIGSGSERVPIARRLISLYDQVVKEK